MIKASELKEKINNGEYFDLFDKLYGNENIQKQTERYVAAVDSFMQIYGNEEISVFSVPGRSEISGNHTDHNHGRVIAAAIDLDIIAVAAKTSNGRIAVKSEGFDEDVVELKNIIPDEKKYFTSASIIAGMCAGFANRGYGYGGFVAYTTNNVYKGSGLSSSAAFEVMIGNILNHFYNDGSVEAPVIAQVAQYAENVFFGKPCGLMDQTACAVGGFVAIDFECPEKPLIEKLNFDLTEKGYSLCITNTGGNHANLNEDYASVPAEMKNVAKHFGCSYLRGITLEQIIEAIPELRSETGDRAILRAMHFIKENERVAVQTEALRNNDLGAFLNGAMLSGKSSYEWLQNVYTTKNVSEQGLSIALAVTETVLEGTGAAWRVHGGGFAGTIQAFVPSAYVEKYCDAMNNIFGAGACAPLRVRTYGAIKAI